MSGNTSPYSGRDAFAPEMLELWARHPGFAAAASNWERYHVEMARLLRRLLSFHFVDVPRSDRESAAWRASERKAYLFEQALCYCRKEVQSGAAFKSLTPAQRAAMEAECFNVPFTIEEMD